MWLVKTIKPERRHGMTDGRLKEELKSVVRYIVMSEDSFDTGVLGESQRLAVCLKAALYDKEGNRSMLGRLGLKNISFYDYSPDYRPELELPFSALAVRTISAKTARYLPRLDQDPRIKPKKLPFDAWWDKVVLVDPESGLKVTRGMLVLAVSNMPMGVHDRKLTGEYESLALQVPPEPIIEIPMVWEEEMGAVLASSVRHIAFELIMSLKEQCPDLFG